MRPRHGRRLRHGCSAQADVEGGPRPIKVGLSTARTGAIAVNGKQFLAALEIWRDDVNGHVDCWAVLWSLFATTTRAIRRTCQTMASSII
jgi:hypothetical protein